MIDATGDPAIARTELMDWYDEMRERAYTARFSLALADMEKEHPRCSEHKEETMMSTEDPLPRGAFEEPSDAVEAPDLKAELTTAVSNLAKARANLRWAKDQVGEIQIDLAESVLGLALATAQAEAHDIGAHVEFFTAQVRGLAIRIHVETAERKPHEAVTIKHYKTPVIMDKALLLDHVRIHVPQCVKLDTRQVTKLARAGLEMPWVEFEEEYRATIATKLDKWMPEESNDDVSLQNPSREEGADAEGDD